MLAVIDTLIPVATLIVGFFLSQMPKRTEARRTAGEKLAELRRHVWEKGTDSEWLDLQVYLGQLRVALRLAGVSAPSVSELLNAANAFWEKVEHSGDESVGWVNMDNETTGRLAAAEEAVLKALDRGWWSTRAREEPDR